MGARAAARWSSGCLYLDDLDQPPTVSLDDVITTHRQGRHPDGARRRFSDPDDPRGELTFTARRRSPPTISSLDPNCDYVIDSRVPRFEIAFFRTGIFRVKVTVFDPHHASAETNEMVTITDAPPIFSSGATIQQTSTRDACDLNTAGDVVTLALDGTVDDADAAVHHSAGCAAGRSR